MSGRHGLEASEALETRSVLRAPKRLQPRLRGLDGGSSGSALGPGSTIDHYVLFAELGEGGMGTVYAAYDRTLDRKVALKCIRVDDRHDEEANARLAREARALAKLSHPNVVQVHEVGEHRGEPYLVMELIDGPDLRQWSQAAGRTQPERLARLIEAGRGLGAAHDAGLLHRDLKPTNVIVGNDGRVRVVDFGLAKAPVDDPAPDSDLLRSLSSARDDASVVSVSEPLTEYGVILGTLPYMAPEQHSIHAEIDARADQYAFCVTAWEILCGERPFHGTRHELAVLKRSGPPPWPTHVKMRRRVTEALRRGLASDPDDRWPSMGALLQELEPRRAPAVRWWALGVGLAFVGGGLATALMPGSEEHASPCTGAPDAIAVSWNEQRRADAERGLLGTGLPFAVDTWQRIEPSLHDYAERWVAMHSDACEATAIRGEQSEEVLDLRMACLERRREVLHATVDMLARADETVLEQAIDLVGQLPGLERCADVAALRARVPPPEDPAVTEELGRLRPTLARAQVQRRAGRFEDARATLGPLLDRAPALGYGPFSARVSLEQGMLLAEVDEPRAALGQLETAYVAAIEHGDDELAARAAGRLATTWANELVVPDQGVTWATTALALARRAGRDGPLEATALVDTGDVLVEAGEAKRAEVMHRRALELSEQDSRSGRYDSAHALLSLGIALNAQGRYDEALEVTERAWELDRQTYGADHPRTIKGLNNVGSMLNDVGRYAEAIPVLERALESTRAAWGPDHPQLISALNNLGVANHYAGETEAALGQMQRALAIAERSLGPDHVEVAGALVNIGGILHGMGRSAEGVELIERAIGIGGRIFGDRHPKLAEYHTALGMLLEGADRPADALLAYQDALEIQRSVLDGAHPHLAMTLSVLGRLQLRRGRPTEADPLIRQALDIRVETLGEEHPGVAESRRDLGLVLAELGDLDGAREQMRSAAEATEESARSRAREDARAWLAEHPEP